MGERTGLTVIVNAAGFLNRCICVRLHDLHGCPMNPDSFKVILSEKVS
jgi:hypothetical protein